MPVYTVYHRTLLDASVRQELGRRFTRLHRNVTGAAPDTVKVIFLYLDEDSFFSGGERQEDYVRVVAQIRHGRTEDQRLTILRGMFEIVNTVVQRLAESIEIQTQIIEIDDANTVMTNGKQNV